MLQDSKVLQIIVDEIDRRRVKNPSYSRRAFARFIGVSPSTLSEILSAKRPLSAKIAIKIATKCDFDEELRRDFLGAALNTTDFVPAPPDDFKVLSREEFREISDWYCYPILNLCELPNNIGAPEWVAKTLSIDVEEARSALEKLKKLDVLEVKDGKLVRKGKRLRIHSDVPNEDLRKHHKQFLQRTMKLIDKTGVDERDLSTITMAIDPKKVPRARELIRDFRRNLAELLSEGEKKRIYTLQITLMPLSDVSLEDGDQDSLG